jgi:hypothetical protein
MLNFCSIVVVILKMDNTAQIQHCPISMSWIDSWHLKISTGLHFQNDHHNTAKIQHWIDMRSLWSEIVNRTCWLFNYAYFDKNLNIALYSGYLESLDCIFGKSVQPVQLWQIYWKALVTVPQFTHGWPLPIFAILFKPYGFVASKDF